MAPWSEITTNRRKTMNNINVLKQLAALPNLSTTELRTKWTELFQSEPPSFNKTYLVRNLAQRIQELVHGTLPSSDERRWDKLAKEDEEPPEQIKLPADRLMPGIKLVREWKGVEHCCTVLDNGFEYLGRRFGSLSAVANAITGTKWNGAVFFKLKKQGQ
jgi:hypothetical protein